MIRRGASLAGLALALLFIAIVYVRLSDGTESRATAQTSVAIPRSVGVVPFVNATGDRADDDLTLIVTDDLLRSYDRSKR